MAVNVEYILSLKDQFSKGINDAKKSADGLDSKMSQLKGGMNSMFSGIAMGAGIGAFNMLSEAVVSFGQNAIKEFEEAVKISAELQRSLRSVGRESYFEGLKNEADNLAESLYGLFDNDEIIQAQSKLISYGKITRSEMSKLIPVIADLASKEGIDLAQATESVINIMAGRGGATLRQYGLTVKGTETEHERLNLILGEFQQKLIGSSETYAKTAQGIEQTNKVLLANIEENFGKTLANLKMKALPIITDLMNGFNYILSASSDKEKIRGSIIANQKGDQISGLLDVREKKYSDARKKGLITEKQEREATIKYYNKTETDLQDAYNKAKIKKEKAVFREEYNYQSDQMAELTNQMGILRQRKLNYEESGKKDFKSVINPTGGATAKDLGTATKTDSKKTRAVGTNATRSQATGSKAITINVSIKDLIGTNNMNITNIKDGANKLQDMVVGALTGAVNDFQLIAE
jgi:hypothetical protein